MQPQAKSSTNIFIILGVLAGLIIAGYFYFTRDRSADEVLTSDSISAVQNDLVVILQKLQTVSLDASIISSIQEPILRDDSHALTAETPGRVNPFAPLPSQLLTPITKSTVSPVPIVKSSGTKK